MAGRDWQPGSAAAARAEVTVGRGARRVQRESCLDHYRALRVHCGRLAHASATGEVYMIKSGAHALVAQTRSAAADFAAGPQHKGLCVQPTDLERLNAWSGCG
jgi:hypothetical protein